jgi:predicted ester cyclase
MAVDIKQSHRRMFEEAWGKGNLAVFDEICDRGFRGHDPVTGDTDLAKERELCRMYRTAFPDITCTLLGSYADNETVVTHWRMSGTHRGALMGVEPTGGRVTVEGISIGKFRSGKLAESWTQWDGLGLLRQLGIAPPMQAGAGARGTETRPHA